MKKKKIDKFFYECSFEKWDFSSIKGIPKGKFDENNRVKKILTIFYKYLLKQPI